MYRSLMFRSNPLNQQLHKDDQKYIKTLQVKNYSFSKINQNTIKKTLKNNDIPSNNFNVKKNRYFINSPNQLNKQHLKHTFLEKSKRLQSNPQDSFVFDKETINMKVQDQPKIRILNTRRRIFKQQENSPVNSPQKHLDVKNIPSYINDSYLNVQQIKKSRRILKSQSKSPRGSDVSQKKSNLLQKSIRPQQDKSMSINQKDNKLKNTLYQSINFDSLFDNIELKVKQSQTHKKDQQTTFPNQNFKFLQKFQKHLKPTTPKTKTPFDQFNLKFLISKKKTIQVQHENLIKGSNMPYYQCLTARENKRPNKKEQSNRHNEQQVLCFEDDNLNQPTIPNTQRISHSKYLNLSTVKNNQKKVDKTSQQKRLDKSSIQKRNQKIPVELQNLRQSLKIQSLRQMFKQQNLKFV